MELKKFAQRLKSFRKKAGLTQEKLADKVNVSMMTVKRWEWGQRQPRMEEIKKLCEVLHVSEAELLNEPQGEEIRLTLSWHWEEMKEGSINMSNDNKFSIVLGDDGRIGLTGAALFPTREAIEDFIRRVSEQVEVAFDAQVRRGVIKEVAAEV